MRVLEREPDLSSVRAVMDRAAGGVGGGVAITGEPGAGKSTLIAAACTGTSLRLLRGSCDPLTTPRPLGPFRDIARQAGLGTLLHGREEMLAEVCDQLYDLVAAEPTVLVVEDLHWVDAASVDVLRFLIRRLEATPLALLISYRDDEIGSSHPARLLLGDLARTDGLQTVRMRPLSITAVAALLADTTLEPARVLEVTGGNPFFVTEVARDPGRPLPMSVRDAVLARAAELPPADLELLQLVACAPDELDDRALAELGVDPVTSSRLDATGLLTRERGGLGFRHELARLAVEGAIPAGGRPPLHARLLRVLSRLAPQEPAVLTHHAVMAGDRPAAVSWAETAARQAIVAGSHTEAAAFLAIALNHLGPTAPAVRADLLQRLSFEQYMTSRLPEAIENVRASFPLWELAGDRGGLARAHETCAVYEYYNAHRRQAVSYVEQAMHIARASGEDTAYGMARATRAFQAFMGSDLELARAGAEEAAEVARATHQPAVQLKSEVVRTLVSVTSGQLEARSELTGQIDNARSHHWDELASTIYSQLSNLDVEQRRYREAERVLEESLPFAVERDIPICHHWQTGIRSRLHFSQGHWDAATEDARHVLDEDGMPLALVWPHLVSGLVALRRGDPIEVADEHLGAAWELATQIDEPLRRLPVLSALAEAAWLTRRSDPRVEVDAVGELARTATLTGAEWARGDLACWLLRLGLLDPSSDGFAEPYRLSVHGRAEDAAHWWRRVGDRFAEAMAWTDGTDTGERIRGVQLLDRLGAIATADRIRVDLRRGGVGRLPARPRSSTRDNPGQLTNRQLDVAKLVARGMTNAEISNRLYISAKTTDHHVSAVLAKLGVPNRRALRVSATELGLV